jgi:hypothetical protein
MTYSLMHRGFGKQKVYFQPNRKLALGGNMWLAPRSGRFTSDKDLVQNVQEAGWALEPVWTT